MAPAAYNAPTLLLSLLTPDPLLPDQIRHHETFLNGHKLCVVMEYAPFGDLTYYINKVCCKGLRRGLAPAQSARRKRFPPTT